MASNLVNLLESSMNIQETETINGAKSYTSCGNACLDLFSKIGAVRNDIPMAIELFSNALNEDIIRAIRILFYSRDIRGGQGERKVFRELLKYLANNNPTEAGKILHLIPEYGRWDDLFVLEDTSLWNDVLYMIRIQINKDINSEDSISLLAKWLPSINASSKDSKRLGRKIAKYLNWPEKVYRKNLSALRQKIKIVEQKMCSRNWSEIEYDKVPSKASLMYRNAFSRRDAARYSQYLIDVENGKKKINAGTVYPYEIIESLTGINAFNGGDVTAELMWKNLPNYMEEEFQGLVVADTSGSMNGRPINVCISLAIYIAERNKSDAWRNKFITFSSKPKIQSIIGDTLASRVSNLEKTEWGYSTNIVAVFKEILKVAQTYNLPAEEMIEKLIIISDMQFDIACENKEKTNFEYIKELYSNAGYELPQLVFWNVNAYGDSPVTIHDTGTCLISGCSPSILKTVIAKKKINPLFVMNDVIYNERYLPVGRALSSPVRHLTYSPLKKS
jgi:hypothetical protein